MRYAIDEAKKAADKGEVPVGAVIAKGDEVVGRGHNMPISTNDPTMHAEIVALRDAASRIGNYRLLGCTMYVTCEPCPMCAGALVHARIKKLVIGADDMKTGACGSVINIVDHEGLNHRIDIERGVLREECSKMMSEFFAKKRRERNLEEKIDEKA
ncbi:MAG: tRNA adenosine(34) deaminase TadA [Eubacteriales bacterium]|nr:tRNA adenosine(34) deaminase TadA [Eubacteriales bacterium]MDY3332325.1 tRNA adenosine(34) deaminase TadA [Gallibacter sp.]